MKQQRRVVPRLVPVVRPSGDAGGSAADEDLAENVFLPADRHTLQKLADSRKLLAEGRYGEAVRFLGAILEGPEDFFFQPDKSAPIHRSLKAEAQRLLGQMPREGRELYELQYGARARRMLAEALEQGDIASVAEVSRRFFHTRSGYRATFLLGLDHFDHGRPLAGALTLERLREAGADAEELEPGLSLTMATCWLQAGVAEKARQVAGIPAAASSGAARGGCRPGGSDLHRRRGGGRLVGGPDRDGDGRQSGGGGPLVDVPGRRRPQRGRGRRHAAV